MITGNPFFGVAGALRGGSGLVSVLFLCALGVLCGEARGQKPDGYVSVGVDALPNAPGSPVELRARIFADEKLTPFEHLGLRATGSLDLLGFRTGVSSRDDLRAAPLAAPGGGHDVIVVPSEFQAEITGPRADLRLGYSRVVWGRLDEVQPTDVVNPLDLARFFFEGRSEARLAVPMARGRLFFGEHANVEAIVVPAFRRGRFDQLDEPTSPFNLERGTVTLPESVTVPLPGTVTVPLPERVTVPLLRREPAATWGNVQGGVRFSATTGRMDWATSFYRGFDAFGTYAPAGTEAIVQTFPRYTMLGADFETTRGEWALRGEVAHFSGELDGVDGGAGFDRRAGDYHLSGTMLVHHEGATACQPQDFECAVSGPRAAYTSTSVVAAADRSFARERYRTRTFAVYNMTEGAAFLRNITSMEVRANLVLEGSIGWFLGNGSSSARRDVIGRFSDRDFAYARLRVHF